MDPDERLQALVAPLRADVVSGAAAVARTAAEVIRRAAVRIPAGSLEELRWGLGEVCRQVLDAQPAMAPLVLLVRNVLDSVAAARTLDDGRLGAANAAESFRGGLESRAEAVAAKAADLMPTGGTVATISSSSTVRAALLHGGRASGRRVVCFESRPMNEGRDLATDLAEEGVRITFAVDAAAHSLVPSCDVVLLGADSIGDLGVVNKVGSASVAGAAARAGVPVYVLADETKILPSGFPQPVHDDRPGDEVWAAPVGVTVWNRYFEVVPFDLVSRIVTEAGVVTPHELAQRREALQFPEVLKRWAEGRATRLA